ncbi:MAG: hypothetical protein N3A69_07560 [Leptospiraceae bacterium]|nr:hypothetical protein [Leptospiraceae bacterium]
MAILFPLISFLAEQENSCESFEKIYSTCIQEIYLDKQVSQSSMKFEFIHFKNFCMKREKETSTCFQYREAPCTALFLCVKKLYDIHTKRD